MNWLRFESFCTCVDENESRTTAIGAAVQISNLPILELLIKYGAKVKADTFSTITPIEEAKELGNEKIIEVLIKQLLEPDSV